MSWEEASSPGKIDEDGGASPSPAPTELASETPVTEKETGAEVAEAAEDSEAARTASSGQQGARATEGEPSENATASAGSAQPGNAAQLQSMPRSESEPSENQSAANTEQMAEETPADQPEDNQLAGANSSFSPSSQPNKSEEEEVSEQQPQGGTPEPPDNFAKSSIDIDPARSASSQQMRLKIDQWAGSFEGQQRRKLELVIGPIMEELDMNLEKAEVLSRGVLDEIDGGESWRAKHNRDVTQAEKRVMAAVQMITDLEGQTANTPYAFIGLQLLDISRAHVEPARRDFWKSLQSDDNPRRDSPRRLAAYASRAGADDDADRAF